MSRMVQLVVVVAAMVACTPTKESSEREPATEVVPAPEPLPAIVELALATGWGCALREDRTLWCWGDDPFVKQGKRKPTQDWAEASQVQIQQQLSHIVARGDWICGIDQPSDATVLCWGEHAAAEQIRGVEHTVALEASSQVCALDDAGVVRCWLDLWRSNTNTTTTARGRGVVALGVGSNTGCGLTAEGDIWCWSQLSDLGMEPDDEGFEPRDAAHLVARVPGAVELDVGDEQLCVRLVDGTVQCTLGSLRERELPYALAPVAGLDEVVALELGARHACALRRGGELRCFGANDWGQLGDVATLPEHTTVLAAANDSSCAAGPTGVWCWGTRSNHVDDRRPVERVELALAATGLAVDRERGCVTTEARELLCWGDGTPVSAKPTLRARDVDPIVKLQGPCWLERDGELRCDQFVPRGWFEPVVSPLLRQRAGVRDFAFGNDVEPTLCMLDDRGVECFDAKSGAALSVAKFQAPIALDFEGESLCVIHDRGALACLFVDIDQLDPLAWTEGFVEFATGRPRNNLCALDAQGWPVCWNVIADDRQYHLMHSGPERVSSLPAAVELAKTEHEICVRTAEGRVGCQALSIFGIDEPAPFEWLDIDDIVELAAGTHHLCMRDRAGDVTCVGDNRTGQLGAPSTTWMREPVRIRGL